MLLMRIVLLGQEFLCQFLRKIKKLKKKRTMKIEKKPPLALSFICKALIFNSFNLLTTSRAANIAFI